MVADARLPSALPTTTQLWFHELNLTDIVALRKKGGTHFELAECAGVRTACVPQNLKTWQSNIRAALRNNNRAHL